MKKYLVAFCIVCLLVGVSIFVGGKISGDASAATTASSYVAIGWNDLGMHCACPRSNIFMLLPPYNTLRVQVIKRGSPPVVINDPTKIDVEYKILENNINGDANYDLMKDPEYVSWLDTAAIHFPGSGISRTNPVGLAGFGLSGLMKPVIEGTSGHWVAQGVPAFPDLDPNGRTVDPFGSKRNPYLTWDVTVKDHATKAVLATTQTTLPVSFGGCCNCHQEVAINKGYVKTGKCPDNRCPDPWDVFQSMMDMHKATSGIDVLKLAGATYDTAGHLTGIATPIRCSRCHRDNAVGGAAAQIGFPSTGQNLAKQSFSEVLHKHHAQSAEVLTSYDANIKNNCYQCHPGNNVNCYRGHHAKDLIQCRSSKYARSIWCTDCHGDLNVRIATGQMAKDWKYDSLPQCENCHNSTGIDSTKTPELFGLYLASYGHKNDKILCSTCHGQPHAELASTLDKDNSQPLKLQNDARSIGKCDVCHIGKSSNWGTPPH